MAEDDGDAAEADVELEAELVTVEEFIEMEDSAELEDNGASVDDDPEIEFESEAPALTLADKLGADDMAELKGMEPNIDDPPEAEGADDDAMADWGTDEDGETPTDFELVGGFKLGVADEALGLDDNVAGLEIDAADTGLLLDGLIGGLLGLTGTLDGGGFPGRLFGGGPDLAGVRRRIPPSAAAHPGRGEAWTMKARVKKTISERNSKIATRAIEGCMRGSENHGALQRCCSTCRQLILSGWLPSVDEDLKISGPQMHLQRCSQCTSLHWVNGSPETHLSATPRPNEPLDISNNTLLRACDVELSGELPLVHEELARFHGVQREIAPEHQNLHAKLCMVNSVPGELWAEIFHIHGDICRASIARADSEKRMAIHFPLMSVCRKWHDTPAIWSFIALYMGTYPPLPVEAAEKVVDLHLSRSGQCLLDVVVTAHAPSSTEIAPYSQILHRLLEESGRMWSLVLDIPLTFPLLTKLDGPFDKLQSLTVSDTRWSVGTSPDDFWRELHRAPIRSLAVEDTLTEQIQFDWERINRLRTDRIELLMERLGDPAGVLCEVEFVGYSHTWDLDPSSFATVVNSRVRLLKIDCRQPYSDLLLQHGQLPILETLELAGCDHIQWRDSIGPHLHDFISVSQIQSLSLEVDFSGEVQMLHRVLGALPRLRSLKVEDFWTDGDMTPISEDHEHWFAFPIRGICDQNVLPMLETFTYRVFPSRFCGAQSLDSRSLQDNLLFMEFLRDLDDFLSNRIHREVATTRAASPLKKIVLRGGGKSLADFPTFLQQIELYKKKGLVFDFDETDLDTM
ncbi:hypothetical protein C8R43DRAFT_943458 [Mycena crocata]|nr:hypothetical protein C8R43DRAFT_943458 [Mycena crocata]